METITRLLEQAKNCINTPGLILCEIEETQKALILDLAVKLFPLAEISVRHDLADKPRLLQIGLQ